MERAHLLVALIIATSAIIHLVQAQDQDGFISLDCGLSLNESFSYIHPESGLKYLSDSGFIQSGIIGKIKDDQEEEFEKKLKTLRYFPDGKRNCYTLNVKEDTKYLIRASFLYGNYDGRNLNPKFDLCIGPNFWISMDLEDEKSYTDEEIIHAPRSNLLDVCLVKTDSSTPFISSLELRPLPNTFYITKSGSLKLKNRYYLSDSDSVIKFPDDVVDRIWWPYFESEWEQISTNLAARISTSLKANNSADLVPQDVITFAATPANASEPLTNKNSLDSPNDQVFFFLYFSEVKDLGAKETREFDILWNGEVFIDGFSPTYLHPKILSSSSPVTCENKKCVLELKKTQRSTLPPLLNAVELYVVADFPQSKTIENDMLAIRGLKATYGIKKISWQGDPCVPKQFLWDGLKCNIVDKSPMITSLDLSSSGLTGTIADGIQNLTYLEKLDLSNNSLVGAVPEYLAHMKSLTLINLSKNKLNGSIPQALRDREKKGLKIIFDGGGEKPCLSCAPKKKFPVLIIIAVVASVVVVIVVVLVFIFVSKRKRASNHMEDIQTSSKTPHANVTYMDATDPSIETKRRKFSFLEVMEMTNNLEKPLGEGGFGVVYHGEVNNSQVAVKLLSKSSAQGYKEFKAEINLLLRVHHINLVNLVGYCDERENLALIYEYMPNVDLKHHLLGKDGASALSWSTLLKVNRSFFTLGKSVTCL